jgi:hypothetical protein
MRGHLSGLPSREVFPAGRLSGAALLSVPALKSSPGQHPEGRGALHREWRDTSPQNGSCTVTFGYCAGTIMESAAYSHSMRNMWRSQVALREPLYNQAAKRKSP